MRHWLNEIRPQLLKLGRVCLLCGGAQVRDHLFCDRCYEYDLLPWKIRQSKSPFSKHCYLFDWVPTKSESLSKLLQELKFCSDMSVFRHYVGLLCNQPEFRKTGILVPVPSKRGEMDHATRLALALSHETGLEVRHLLRFPAGDGQPQRRKALTDRSSIRLLCDEKVSKNADLILVDDVLTTGATVNAAKKALGPVANLQIVTLAYRHSLATQ